MGTEIFPIPSVTSIGNPAKLKEIEREITCPWQASVGERLSELSLLTPNWDGHGARSIKDSIIHYAKCVMEKIFYEDTPPPYIVPLPWGGLQLEWHLQNCDLEVSIGDPYQVSFCFVEVVDGQEGEPFESKNDARLQDFIRRLTPGNERPAEKLCG